MGCAYCRLVGECVVHLNKTEPGVGHGLLGCQTLGRVYHQQFPYLQHVEHTGHSTLMPPPPPPQDLQSRLVADALEHCIKPHLTAGPSTLNAHFPSPPLTRSFASSETSSHSGLANWYRPSMMARSMTSCLRCQKGGKPTNL